MITRTEDGILITPEDIPQIAGMVGGFIAHMEDIKDQIPGSFENYMNHMMESVHALQDAVRKGPPKP